MLEDFGCDLDRTYQDVPRLRAVTRDDHLAYVARSGAMVRMAGPLLSDDGESMIGSLIVLEAETLDAARAWAAEDPYARVGLFERVDVKGWRWLIADGAKRQV